MIKNNSETVDYIIKNITSHIIQENEQIHLITTLYGLITNDKNIELHLKIAKCLELMKISTLITDDILDKTTQRNSKKSLFLELGIEKSLLIAEILKSTASLKFNDSIFNLEDISEIQKNKCIQVFEDTYRTVCFGQFQDMSLYDRFVKVGFIDYDDYFELIRNTTAVFIQLPFFIASVINNDQEKKLQSMLDLGMLIGLSYQIRDDILDLVVIDESGTILQSDIQEKKIRLPLIHCIKNSNQIDKDIIINILKKDIINKENVIIIYNLLKKYQSIKYTIEVSEIILKKAENIINEYVNKDNQESFFEILKMLRGNINEYTFE